jgi:hypothetical protein
MAWPHGVTDCRQTAGGSPRPQPGRGDPAGKVPVTQRPVDTLCQRCAAQGPTPETRSTLM